MHHLRLKLALFSLVLCVAACAPSAPSILSPLAHAPKKLDAYNVRVRDAVAKMKWVNFSAHTRRSLTDAIITTYSQVLTAMEPNNETLPVPSGFEAYVPLVRSYMTSEAMVQALESVKTIENNAGSQSNAYGNRGWIGIGQGYFDVINTPKYQAAVIDKEAFVSLLSIQEPMPQFACDGPTRVGSAALIKYVSSHEIKTQALAGMFKLAFGGDPSLNLEHIQDVETHPEHWWHDPCF